MAPSQGAKGRIWSKINVKAQRERTDLDFRIILKGY
jgi:hypothetical protein